MILDPITVREPRRERSQASRPVVHPLKECQRGRVDRRTRVANPTKPVPSNNKVAGSGTTSPCSSNAMLNVGGVAPPTMSVPMRNQSGSRAPFRIQACRSGEIGVFGDVAGIGLCAESQKKFPAVSPTCGTKK